MKKIRARVEVLSPEEIELIHRSSLRILEQTGIKVPNDECLDICRSFGARVDREKSLVKIPRELMEDILAKVRSPGCEEKKDCEEVRKLSTHISTQIFIVDYRSKTRRYGLLDDLLKGIALVDHLDNFNNTNAIVIPSDIPYNITDVVSHQLIFKYSRKPGGTYILSPTSAKYILQMAKVMGKDTSYLLESVSPLQFRKESLEMALVFAKAGQSLRMAPMVTGGTTGPVTLAGTVTLQNTEVLASLFLIYVFTEKFANYTSPAHTSDLRTMLCSFGAPNQALLGVCMGQLGRFYGLKSTSNSGLTDAMLPDFQGGFEKASSAILSCLSGTADIGCQGIVGADQGISLEQLVIDNEWIDAYNYMLQGIEVTEETVAADLIEKVGIGGNFVAEEHTGLHMRENYWPSRIFSRDNWSNWKDKGADELLDRAHEYVEAVAGNYRSMAPVVDEGTADELDYIAGCAKEELEREMRQ